jgi:uncharacterized membrane protein YtjA (UPF0391 family)
VVVLVIAVDPPKTSGRVRVIALDATMEPIMIYYALVFLVVALIAGALGVVGVAAIASKIAWILFLIGLVLLVVHLITGRRTLTP